LNNDIFAQEIFNRRRIDFGPAATGPSRKALRRIELLPGGLPRILSTFIMFYVLQYGIPGEDVKK
jgi:hypothetical protein